MGEVSTLLEIEEEEDLNSCPWPKVAKELDIGENNSPEERSLINSMLQELEAVFGKEEGGIGQAKVKPHAIELSNYTPIWQRPRRFAEPVTDEIERQCEELLSLDIIEHSQSPWSSPIVPVRKKDGQLRLCIDYPKVNSITVTEKFPMPNMGDAIYSARNAKYFSKLDLVKGYYQIPMEEDSRQYTAFSTPHNHYQFKTLSFGLKNSGIYFQRTMQEILAEFCFKDIIVYIDDILIMSESFEQHMALTRKVLQTLRNNGIKVNPAKCEFFKQEVEFLGHVISGKGIRKSPMFIEKIKDFPKPNTVTELRQFLGLANFQGRFIPNLSVLSKTLTQVTGGPKRKHLVWTQDMEKSFLEIRRQLAMEVMLSFPDYSKDAEPLELSVDASGVGAGGCLQQRQNGEYKTIAYASVTFSKAHTRYSTIERELCAIRWGLKIFRPFLFGIKFVLFTDHKPLLYLQNMSHENSRLMRTIEELAEYDFQIRYKPGQDNVVADVMSRPVVEEPTEEFETKQHGLLPEGMAVLEEVKGGGDSMFIALFILLRYFSSECKAQEIPDSPAKLRYSLVKRLLDDHKKYGVKVNKGQKKILEAMKIPGCVPCEAVFLVACDVFGVEIWVHHGMKSPVIYRCESTGNEKKELVLHLQCISGINFNPVVCCKSKETLVNLVREKNINCISTREEVVEMDEQEEVEDLDIGSLMLRFESCAKVCDHELIPDAGVLVSVGGCRFCALVDTGAQVSLISKSRWERIKFRSPELQHVEQTDNVLHGINRAKTSIVGVVELQVCIMGQEFRKLLFAIVEDQHLGCCCLLGANFLALNGIVIDYSCGELQVGDSFSYPLVNQEALQTRKEFLGQVYEEAKVRYRMLTDIQTLQENDDVIQQVRQHIEQGVPASE